MHVTSFMHSRSLLVIAYYEYVSIFKTTRVKSNIKSNTLLLSQEHSNNTILRTNVLFQFACTFVVLIYCGNFGHLLSLPY